MIGQQTTLDLNGPILGFTTQPQSTSICDGGSVTFVGIATVTFPTQTPSNSFTNTGSLSYRWYATGVGPLSDGTFRGSTITGTATTTLAISNAVSSNINNTEFYLGVDYVASAYGLPGVAVTVGSARSTGNAINEILLSNRATLTAYPTISVVTSPVDQIVAQQRTATFIARGYANDNSNVSYQWQLNGVDLSDSSTVSGSRTSVLSISSSTIGISTVRAKITHPTSCNSPVYSDIANFNVVSPRDIITFEFVNESTAGSEVTYDFPLTPTSTYTVAPSIQGTPITTVFYASEKDLDVIIDIFAGKGSDFGSYQGGEGGISSIKLRLQRNVEYIIATLQQPGGGQAVYLYRKGRLIAVAGSGGSAGSSGNGGRGGGINVSGEKGFGTGGGNGGALVSAGNLSSSGIFGSFGTQTTTLPGDTTASAPSGGRTIPCPKGNYWYVVRGIAPCNDNGTAVRYIRENGEEVTNSGPINRGFKPGYAINNTVGAGINGGNGGAGATGGNGGTNGGGGGGGSGYTDGSIEVISSQQGGNTGEAKVVIRAVRSSTYSISKISDATESGSATFSISRTGTTTIDGSVRFFTQSGSATAGVDFNSVDQIVSFAANQTVANVSVSTRTDTLTEGTESFTGNIGKINADDIIATSSATAFIYDVPPPPPPPPLPPPPPPIPPPPPACTDTFYVYIYGGGGGVGSCPVGFARVGRYYLSTNGVYNPNYTHTQGGVRLVNDVYVTYLNRPAHMNEIASLRDYYGQIGGAAFTQQVRNSAEAQTAFTRPFPTTVCGRSLTAYSSDIWPSINCQTNPGPIGPFYTT